MAEEILDVDIAAIVTPVKQSRRIVMRVIKAIHSLLVFKSKHHDAFKLFKTVKLRALLLQAVNVSEDEVDDCIDIFSAFVGQCDV